MRLYGETDNKLEEVAFSFNRHAFLENVDMSVFEKDFMAIIGPNGGGKTTLLKLILQNLSSKQPKMNRYPRACSDKNTYY